MVKKVYTILVGYYGFGVTFVKNTERKMNKFKVIGFNHKRTETNPRELLFVEQINKEIGFSRNVLSQIVYANAVNKPLLKKLTPHEEQIVVSVIQWLGSPIGKCFLNQVNEKDTHK